MKRTFFRAFGIACFLIGMIIFFSNRFDLPFITSDSESNEAEEEIEKLKKQLDEKTKQIQKLEAQLKETENKNTDEKDDETDKERKNEKESTEEKDVVKGTLHIYSGLSIFDVAKKLKDMGIIENSVEMELFLAQPEYAKSLQIGQYELDSSMTIEEIANIITGKKKKDKDKKKSK